MACQICIFELVFRCIVRRIVGRKRHDCFGNSLLHNACDVRVCEKSDAEQLSLPPLNIDPNLVEILLQASADLNSVNDDGKTPIKLAFDFARELANSEDIQADQMNATELLLRVIIWHTKHLRVCHAFGGSLKCLAAQVVVQSGIKYRGVVPSSIESFIDVHVRDKETLAS